MADHNQRSLLKGGPDTGSAMTRRSFVKRAIAGATALGTFGAFDDTVARAQSTALGTRPYLGGGTVHVIQTSHSDIAWPDGYPIGAAMDNDRMERALSLFQQSPGVKYCSEDTLHLEQFFAGRAPDQLNELTAAIESGRYQIGAAYSSPYEELLYGDLAARQFYFGRKWFKSLYPGQDTNTYFVQDPPMRGLQTSQLLTKAGIPFEFTSRPYGTIPHVSDDALLAWSSPDGSSTLVLLYAHYGQYYYGNFGETAIDMSSIESLKAHIDEWDGYFAERMLPKHLPLVLSHDDRYPENYDTEIAHWNAWAQANGYPVLSYSTMGEALAAINDEKPTLLDKAAGARPNLWFYEASPTNHKIVSLQREGSMLASAAEAFATFSCLLQPGNFDSYPQEPLTLAWRSLAWACHGWAKQLTLDEFQGKYASARDSARALLTNALESLAAQVKVKDIGLPLVLFNALSWKRSEIATVDLPPGAPEHLVVRDDDGMIVPHQKIEGNKMVFKAADIPPFGYRTFYLASANAKSPAESLLGAVWNTPYENRFYRITPASGGLMGVYDKDLGAELFDTSTSLAGELLMLDSKGGMGAGEFTTFPYAGGILDRSSSRNMTWTCTEDGPIRTAFETSVAFTNFTFHLVVTVYSDSKRIDFEPTIVDWDGTNNRELRLSFPIDSEGKKVSYDVPYGVATVGVTDVNPDFFGWGAGQQPREIQNSIYCEAETFGVTLSSSIAPFDYVDQMTGGAQNISCGPEGQVYCIRAGLSQSRQRVMEWNGTTWQDVPLTAGNLALGSDGNSQRSRASNGNIWVIDKAGLLLEFDGKVWTQRATDAQSVACGADGTVVYVGVDQTADGGHIYRWDGATWQSLPGWACRIAVAPSGHIWVVNRGGEVFEYDGTNWINRFEPRTSSKANLQPILLATRNSCAGNGFFWSQIGTHEYRFSLYSARLGYRDGHRKGIEFNNPLIPISTKRSLHPTLPERFSFASVDKPNVIVSAIKKADDAPHLVVRMYDADGVECTAGVTIARKLLSARTASLIEEDGNPLPVSGATADVPVGRYAIETCMLVPELIEPQG